MAKARTTTRQIPGTDILIEIPVGSMDPPTKEMEAIMASHQDPRGWKYPLSSAIFREQGEAEDYAHCLNWHVGGHEMTTAEEGTVWVVTSKGYYHYVGA